MEIKFRITNKPEQRFTNVIETILMHIREVNSCLALVLAWLLKLFEHAIQLYVMWGILYH